MKIPVAITLAILMTGSTVTAATYNITANNTWTGSIGSASCWTCTINITPGKTFTANYNGTCGTCTIAGGNILITQPLTCQTCAFSNDTITLSGGFQLNLQSATTTFTNTVFVITGSSSILSTAGITIKNSIFTFSNTAYFNNNGGLFTADNSTVTFNGSSNFQTNSGLDLKNNSRFTIGDGTLASTAYMYNNSGTKMAVYDNSLIKIANENNSYRNNSNYVYHPASGPNVNYNINPNTISCGTGHTNSCQTNYIYGCATLNSAGPLGCTTLALAVGGFSARITGACAVTLAWEGDQEARAALYGIERSANGIDWTSLGTVTTLRYLSSYQYTDPAAPSGTVIYRIRIADKDGKSSYSTIRTVILTTAREISIYPNPVTDRNIFLRTASTDAIVMNVYTLSGQLLFVTSLKGQTLYTVKLPPSVTPNNYIVIQTISHEKSQAFNLMVR